MHRLIADRRAGGGKAMEERLAAFLRRTGEEIPSACWKYSVNQRCASSMPSPAIFSSR